MTFNTGAHLEDRLFLSNYDNYLISMLRPLYSVSWITGYLYYFLNSLALHLVNLTYIMAKPHILLFSILSPLFSFLNGSLLTSFFNTLTFNLTILKAPLSITPISYGLGRSATNSLEASSRSFSSTDTDSQSYYNQFMFIENASSQRATRFSNLLVNYDYKTGHYLGS